MFTFSFSQALARILAVMGLVALVMVVGPVTGALLGGDVVSTYYQRFHHLLREPTGGEAPHSQQILYFGPSDTAVNFSPREFDSSLARLSGRQWRSYNLGNFMAGPDVISELVAQTRKNLARREGRVGLTLIRFMPMMYTDNYKWLANRQRDRFLYPLPLSTSPADGHRPWISLLTRAYFRALPLAVGAGSGAGVVHIWLGQWLFADGNPRPFRDLWSNYSEIYREFADLRERVAATGPWSHADRGQLPEFAPPADARSRASLLFAGNLMHRIFYDFEDLNFDPRHFAHLDRMIEEAKTFSDRVAVVFLDDYFGGQPYARTHLGEQRLREALAALEARDDITLLDLTRDFHAAPEDYVDMVHMTSLGQKKFNTLLARRVEEILGR